MPQWDMVSALTTLAIVPFVLQCHWWKVVKTMHHYIRLHFNPELSRCQRLCWGDIPNCQLHRCPYTGSCYPYHRPETCWKELFCGVLNVETPKSWTAKPTGLPLDKQFLNTDRTTLLAFIFLTSPKIWDPDLSKTTKSIVHLGGAKISFRRDSKSGVVVVHVEGRLEHEGRLDQLTKSEVECLIKGYPPFYREWINCGKFTIPSPIQTSDDRFRGGWIIGIGLSDGKAAPTPVYWDYEELQDLRNGRPRREVIWHSLERVLLILKTSMLVNFPGDIDVQNTVNAVSYMIHQITNSGARNFVRDSMLDPKHRHSLSRQQCIQAMNIFNGSPVPRDEDLARSKAEVKPMLIGLLAAAFIGVEECLSYIKNGGRQISGVLPPLLMEEEEFYIQACL